ncbi:MAG: hypothetical protein WBO24_11715 [Nitrospirales bacterium]
MEPLPVQDWPECCVWGLRDFKSPIIMYPVLMVKKDTPEIVNGLVSLPSKPMTFLIKTLNFNGPVGTFLIPTTFANTSNLFIRKRLFAVVELSGGSILLHANAGPGGVGATVTPDVGDDGVLSHG